MRKDMAKVVVTRPRMVDSVTRKGRSAPTETLPKKIGLRRHVQERGGYKMLNENLAPLRRYLAAQVGRPWNAVYAEISANLKPSSTVQQHVRDHLEDFVNLHPKPGLRRRWIDAFQRWMSEPAPWFEPLYVDAKGILRRTEDLAWVKTHERRRKARLACNSSPVRLRLSKFVELRKIDGFWFEVRLEALPSAEYRRVRRSVKQPTNPYDPAAPERLIETWVHQLVTPAVRDVVTGEAVLAGPETDDHEARRRYREQHPEPLFARSKRQLSRKELHRHGLQNDIHPPPAAKGLKTDMPIRWATPPRYSR